MAERPTAGYDIHNATGVVGILTDFDDGIEGDTEDISGMGNTQGGVIRRKGAPVDVGETITFSGIIDEEAAGFTTFRAAMRGRTADTELSMLKDGGGFKYTGHCDSYNETATRSESTWKFSCTFYVNKTETETPAG